MTSLYYTPPAAPEEWERQLGQTLAVVRSYVSRRLGSRPTEVEDVLQEACLRAVKRRGLYDPRRGTLAAWICGLAQRVLLERVRALRPHHAASSDGGEPEFRDHHLPAPPQAVQRKETCLWVAATLSQLPAEYAFALVEHHGHGRSIREIAAELNKSEAATMALLDRARKRFRNEVRRLVP